MVRLNKTLSILAVSLLLTLASCDPVGSSTTSQNEESSSIVFENKDSTGFWLISSSCKRPCTKDFYFTLKKTDDYVMYSTGSSDTFGSLYESKNNEFDLISSKVDNDSGQGKNFRIEKRLYSGYFYKLTVMLLTPIEAGKYVYVYLS